MPAFEVSTTGHTKAGSPKLLKTVKGDFISIESEWIKELDVQRFVKTDLKKQLALSLREIGDMLIKRSKLQASGPKRITGLPLTAPHKVRILTGRYRRSFVKRVKEHNRLPKAILDVGNRMFYYKYIEAKTGNVTSALFLMWKLILTKLSLGMGKALTSWEAKK